MNISTEYQELLKDVIDNGVERADRTGTGTIAVFGRMVSHDMSKGFPLLTTKRVWLKGVLNELLWFLQGGENIKYLVDNGVNIWNEWPFQQYVKKMKLNIEPGTKEWDTEIIKYRDNIINSSDFAQKHGNTGPIYGSQWVNFNGDGINQISGVIEQLKNNPDSRRILVTALNPSKQKQMVLEPCHYSFQFDTSEIPFYDRFNLFIKENPKYSKLPSNEIRRKMDDENFKSRYISLLWNQRSVDTALGLPFDIASYGLLLMMIGQQVNMEPKYLKGMLGNVHIYKNHINGVKEMLTRDPLKYKLPKIIINKANDIFSYSYDDVKLFDYNTYPLIKFKISV